MGFKNSPCLKAGTHQRGGLLHLVVVIIGFDWASAQGDRFNYFFLCQGRKDLKGRSHIPFGLGWLMAKFSWLEWVALLNAILSLRSAILDLPSHLLMRLMGKQGLSPPQL